MGSIALLVVVSLMSTLGASKPVEEGPAAAVPPWFATVGQVDLKTNSLVLHVRTVHFVVEEGARGGEKVAVDGKPAVRPVYETRTRSIPLESASFAEAGGKVIGAADVVKRLPVGTPVVVSADGQPVDPVFVKCLANDTVVIVERKLAKAGLLFPPSIDFQGPSLRASEIK